jgi:hypothetical protein
MSLLALQPQRIPLFPLSTPLLPDSVMALQIFEVRYLHLIKKCHAEQTPFGIVAIRQGSEVQKAGLNEETLYTVGCLARVYSIDTIHPALLRMVCLGGSRFNLANSRKEGLGLWYADATLLAEDPNVDIPSNLQSCADKLGALIAQSQRQGVIEQLPFKAPYRLDEAGWVANQWAMLLPLTTDDKIAIMSVIDPVQRLTQVSAWLDR